MDRLKHEINLRDTKELKKINISLMSMEEFAEYQSAQLASDIKAYKDQVKLFKGRTNRTNRKIKGKKFTTISVRFSSEQHIEAKLFALENELSIAQLVEISLEYYIKNN